MKTGPKPDICSKTGQPPVEVLIILSMKKSELTNQQKRLLLVPCPICGAAIGVHCQMYSGFGRRNEAHAERKYQAVQAVEQDYGPPGRNLVVASPSYRA